MTRMLCKLATFALWMLVAPLPAFATVIFTFDQANQTVTRPTSGMVSVTFSGTLTKDTTDSIASAFVSRPFDSAGASLDETPLGATIFALGDAARFTVTVTSASPLGLYNLFATLMSPAVFTYTYTDAAGAQHVTSTAFSVNVVAAPAPEPATLALLGIGLAGIGFARRRKLR